MRVLPVLFLATAVGSACAQEQPPYTFGTTVVSSSGLQGRVYHLKPGTLKLPKLERMVPVGTIYVNSLNIPPRRFDLGFPGITERVEWFAIEYTGEFWIETAGRYLFNLQSDDGAKLFIDNKLVINNDYSHPPETVGGSAVLTRGVHQLRVPYFQGPRFDVALVLAIARLGDPWRIFDTSEFKPPADQADWVKGKIHEIKKGESRQVVDQE